MPQAERCWAPSRTLTSLVGDKLDGMSAGEGGRGMARGEGGKVTKPTSVLGGCMGCRPCHSTGRPPGNGLGALQDKAGDVHGVGLTGPTGGVNIENRS